MAIPNAESVIVRRFPVSMYDIYLHSSKRTIFKLLVFPCLDSTEAVANMWMPMHRRPSYLTNKRKRPQATPSFLLPVPKTKKLKCENKLIADLEIGHASMQGYRVSMEDEHIIDSMTGLPDHALVAIMDGISLCNFFLQLNKILGIGHAGSFSAEFVSVHLKNKIEETEEWKEYSSLTENERITQVGIISKALVQAYIHIDEDLRGLKECGIMVSLCRWIISLVFINLPYRMSPDVRWSVQLLLPAISFARMLGILDAFWVKKVK